MTWKTVTRVIMKGSTLQWRGSGGARGKQRTETWMGSKETEHVKDQNWLCQGQGRGGKRRSKRRKRQPRERWKRQEG